MASHYNNSLTDNLEVDLLRSMIVAVTTALCFFGFFVDGNPSDKFTLWMYFIAVSPIIFFATLLIKKSPQMTLILLDIILLTSSLVFKQYVYYMGNELSFVKIILVILHFAVINYFFWKVSKTLMLTDVEADISMVTESKNKAVKSRKFARRRNRRENFNKKNTIKIKSGQYRG